MGCRSESKRAQQMKRLRPAMCGVCGSNGHGVGKKPSHRNMRVPSHAVTAVVQGVIAPHRFVRPSCTRSEDGAIWKHRRTRPSGTC